MNRRLLDYTPEMEFLDEAGSAPAPHSAAMSFGAELLEVADEAELEAFLTELVSALAPLAPPLGKALVAELKRAVRPLMPIRSNGAGAADLNTRAARLFGMELEGLSPEDKEFEVAQQFVRLGADASRTAAATARAGAPQAVAAAAVQQAARRYAPGLLRLQAQASPQSGRWQRQGGRIVVFNC